MIKIEDINLCEKCKKELLKQGFRIVKYNEADEEIEVTPPYTN